jgi:putative methionine-R-sulfoxide reductase with GAF domain
MLKVSKNNNRKSNLNNLIVGVNSLLQNEDDLISGLANISSVINQYINDIN